MYTLDHSFLLSPFMVWLGVHIAWFIALLIGLAWLIGWFIDPGAADRDRRRRHRAQRDEEPYYYWQQPWWLNQQADARHAEEHRRAEAEEHRHHH